MKTYYKTHLEIRQHDKKINDEILDQYISNYSFRMRNLIDNVRHDFWKNYGDRIIQLALEEKLLFRVKFINTLLSSTQTNFRVSTLHVRNQQLHAVLILVEFYVLLLGHRSALSKNTNYDLLISLSAETS